MLMLPGIMSLFRLACSRSPSEDRLGECRAKAGNFCGRGTPAEGASWQWNGGCGGSGHAARFGLGRLAGPWTDRTLLHEHSEKCGSRV